MAHWCKICDRTWSGRWKFTNNWTHKNKHQWNIILCIEILIQEKNNAWRLSVCVLWGPIKPTREGLQRIQSLVMLECTYWWYNSWCTVQKTLTINSYFCWLLTNFYRWHFTTKLYFSVENYSANCKLVVKKGYWFSDARRQSKPPTKISTWHRCWPINAVNRCCRVLLVEAKYVPALRRTWTSWNVWAFCSVLK